MIREFPTKISQLMASEIWGGVCQGFDAYLVAQFIERTGGVGVFVARDACRADAFIECFRFFRPKVEVLFFPDWNTRPYDRLDPKTDIMAARLNVLAQLKAPSSKHFLLVTTVSAIVQVVPPRSAIDGHLLNLSVGAVLSRDVFLNFAAHHGYYRLETVRAPGEFEIRGDIIDIFPASFERPIRIYFLEDTIERVRFFDPISQKSTSDLLKKIMLVPANEVFLTHETIENFLHRYRNAFGASSLHDPLYKSIEQGRSYPGMTHWLPFFYDQSTYLKDYLQDATYFFDHQASEVFNTLTLQIADHYQARIFQLQSSEYVSCRPVTPGDFYMAQEQWSDMKGVHFSPFATPEDTRTFESKAAPQFMPRKNMEQEIVYAHIKEFCSTCNSPILFSGETTGDVERVSHFLEGHASISVTTCSSLSEMSRSKRGLAVLKIANGFQSPSLTILSSFNLFGERFKRSVKRRLTHKMLTLETSGFEVEDLLVHRDHGVGRYDGLVTLDTGQGPHDYLRLCYAGDDRLYVPVEHIGVLSNFGRARDVVLDKLGASAWKKRKENVEKRIFAIAEKLMSIAAKRALEVGEVLEPPEGAYQEFCDQFPYTETDDQLRAMEEISRDLACGKPMERLVCGDVGFGKTEVAMRAAFISIASGGQVAVVVPTTLLARQHYQTFKERFQGFAFEVGHLSRIVSGQTRKKTLEGLKDGRIQIVIGTHAVFAKNISFQHLSLIVIDEEQHFGVGQKERLKNLHPGVHMLSLSATPIPRTLQMAMTGIKAMSLIATPPANRLAIQSFVLPYDSVIIREAVLREYYRGGQVYYVCPRLSDIDSVYHALTTLVPEVTVVIAHGQLPTAQLEKVITDFANGIYQVLLSTSIVESGLDIPSANTLIVHRSDMFGLSQLYQLRGRVGRTTTRSYAYFTLPPYRYLAEKAQKRLEALQVLDGLGAGFSVATHDMEIRGTGNLVGAEQSGYIKEVGLELYQSMLQDAIQSQTKDAVPAEKRDWHPQINIVMEVRIPENYVSDLGMRLGLYRRIANLQGTSMIDDFRVELIDRFGSLPESVENLLKIVVLKKLCLSLYIEKIDAGDRGAVFTFYKNHFPNPEQLIQFVTEHKDFLKLRPDQKLVLLRDWPDVDASLEGIKSFLETFSSSVL